MKASLLCLLPVCVACSFLDPPLPMGFPRMADEPGLRMPGDSVSAVPRKDTIFLVSAVSFPASYDWQRDSSYGSVECKVSLYKGREEVLSVAGGPGTHVGASPDGHHIIDGSLYTVFTDSSGTFVERDGEALASWPEREYLLGLLCRDGELHTLGRGSGFTYRIDGKAVLKMASGSPFGSFGQDTYGSTGALYEDDGSVCFAYQTAVGPDRQAYIVRDGSPSLAMASSLVKFIDVKQIEGKPALLYLERDVSVLSYAGKTSNISQTGFLRWDSAGVLLVEGEVRVAGHFNVMHEEGREFWGVGGDNFCYGFEEPALFLYTGSSGYVWLMASRPELSSSYFFGRDCGCMVGDSLALAFTPRDSLRPPFVKFRDRVTEYPMHGFLSGLSYVIE